MDYTAQQFKDAARRAYQAGDYASAKSLIARGRALEASQPSAETGSALSPEQIASLKAAKAGTLKVDPAHRAQAEELNAKGLKAIVGDEGRVMAGLEGHAQGITLGLSDEILAGMDHFIDGKDYNQSLAFRRAQLAAARDNHPGYAYGGELIGAVVSPINKISAPFKVAEGAGVAARIAPEAANAALQGGLYSFNAADGGAGKRAESAAYGAGISGLIGGALPVAGKVAGFAKDHLVKNPALAVSGVRNDTVARNYVADVLAKSGKSADEVDAAVARAAANGQPEYTVADAIGKEGGRALGALSRAPGNARDKIAQALWDRQTEQASRIGGFIGEAFGADGTKKAMRKAEEAVRKAEANVNYGAAGSMAAPVDVRGALATIDERLKPMRGMGVADDGIAAKLAKYRSRLAAANPKKPNTSVELSDFNRVLGVKREIGDEIGAAVRAGRNYEASELGKLKAALDSALEDASPGYRKANDDFAAASRVIDQFDEGSNAARTGVRFQDTIDHFGGLNAPQQDAFRTGYADAILGKVEGKDIGVNATRNLTGEKRAAEIAAMDKTGNLNDRIAREADMFRTHSVATGGAATAERLSDDAVLSASLSFAGDLASGNYKALALRAAGKFVAAGTGQNDATKAEIARILMGSDIKTAIQEARAMNIAKNEKAAIIRDILNRALMPVKAGAASSYTSR